MVGEIKTLLDKIQEGEKRLKQLEADLYYLQGYLDRLREEYAEQKDKPEPAEVEEAQ